jgi:glutamate dehydrogenase
MRAILRMKVDLLWNGGIGTAMTAADESHGEVRDRANDAIRADGREIRAKVLGKAATGCTRGRVEYAQSGGPERPAAASTPTSSTTPPV